MEFKEFVEGCLRTESKPDTAMYARLEDDALLRGLHAAMGLCTEVGELLTCMGEENTDNTNAKEELGDILWYVALFLDAVVIDDSVYDACVDKLESIESSADGNPYIMESVMTLVEITAGLLDQFKRCIFYGRGTDDVDLIQAILAVCEQVAYIVDFLEFDIEDIQKKVLDKLRARYPEKFTSENAINRDLAVERAVLEGNSDITMGG